MPSSSSSSSSSMIKQLNDSLYEKNNTNDNDNDNDNYMDKVLSSLSLSFRSLSLSIDMLMLQKKNAYIARGTCHYSDNTVNEGYHISILKGIRNRLYHISVDTNSSSNSNSDSNHMSIDTTTTTTTNSNSNHMSIDTTTTNSTTNSIIEIYAMGGHLISDRILVHNDSNNDSNNDSSNDSNNDASISYVLFGNACTVDSPYIEYGYVCRLIYMINNDNDSITTCTSFLLMLLLVSNDDDDDDSVSNHNDTHNQYNDWNLIQLVILHVRYVYEVLNHHHHHHHHHQQHHHHRLQVNRLCLKRFLLYRNTINKYIHNNGHNDYHNYSKKNMVVLLLQSIDLLLVPNTKTTIETLLNYMIN